MPGQSKDFKRKVGKNVGSDDPNKSQYSTAYGTYIGDYGTPRNPDFLVNDPKELEALIKQRNQAAYGGISSDIRETLGSAGLLGSGALPEALAGAQIRLGQQTAGDISSLYMSELERKRNFDIARALQLLQGDTQKAQIDQVNNQDFLNQLLGVGGAVGIAGIPYLDKLLGSSNRIPASEFTGGR